MFSRHFKKLLKQNGTTSVLMNIRPDQRVIGSALMNTTLETVGCLDETPGLSPWTEGGVYYVQVSHPASEHPMRIALHGVCNPEQASAALSVLSQRRMPEVMAPSGGRDFETSLHCRATGQPG
jgi:hypothetical protein